MDLTRLLLGSPLATENENADRIGPAKGIPVFGLDALSSAGYGPEAALTLLIPLGMAGVSQILPIIGSILILLTIVYFSYQQTITAYPHGGGSYTVATENLGVGPGLLAAAALMIDYILTAAVGISAGVGALVSAAPWLQKDTLILCLVILAVLTVINLRGASEAGAVFLVPTYLFIGCLLALIVWGVFKTIAAGGHPIPVVTPPQLKGPTEAISAWLILRAFASGCTAMTGVEAVSNGVMAFKDPPDKYARRTLTIIIAILMVMLGGIAYLVSAFHIAATVPGEAGYQSVLSQLIAAIAGRGAFYWVSSASIFIVLALSANTAFADFPRLAHAIADKGYLPHALKLRGRRLVFEQGVYALAILAGALLVLFGGITDRLIPLYAVGAFLAFTLSQAGMVVHWKRLGGKGAAKNMFFNGLGALATGLTVLVVLVAKFVEGAWITTILIPVMILLMYAVKRHYLAVQKETCLNTPASVADLRPPMVVLPIKDWNVVTERALRFAWTLSPDIRVLHVACGEQGEDLQNRWVELAQAPAKQAGLGVPELIVIASPYRFVVGPILDRVDQLEKEFPDRQIVVIIPELVETRWYFYLLHNNRIRVLKAMLIFRGNQRVTVLNIPWYLK